MKHLCIKNLTMKIGSKIEAIEGKVYDIEQDGNLWKFIDESKDNHHLTDKVLKEFFVQKPTLKEYDYEDKDDKKLYDDMLDECNEKVTIGSLSYPPSQVLFKVDPIAYRCGFSDYVSDLPERWECPICDRIHEEEENAMYCCQERK